MVHSDTRLQLHYNIVTRLPAILFSRIVTVCFVIILIYSCYIWKKISEQDCSYSLLFQTSS